MNGRRLERCRGNASNKAAKRIAKLKGFFLQAYSVIMFRYASWNTAALQKQGRNLNVGRLHIGCGHVLLSGWLNIAFETREEYGRIKTRGGAPYLNYNLLKPWPFDSGSIEYIAASHFIEHLDLNQGMEFTKRCYGVLKSGGVLRLSCPDLELYAKNYAQNNKNFFNHPLIKEWCCFKNAVTPGEIFIAKAYDSGGSHKWFYDFESLKHILEAAGFTSVQRVGRLEGRTPDLKKIELEKRELETVYMEAVKI